MRIRIADADSDADYLQNENTLEPAAAAAAAEETQVEEVEEEEAGDGVHVSQDPKDVLDDTDTSPAGPTAAGTAMEVPNSGIPPDDGGSVGDGVAQSPTPEQDVDGETAARQDESVPSPDDSEELPPKKELKTTKKKRTKKEALHLSESDVGSAVEVSGYSSHGIIRFVGKQEGAEKFRCGVELDDPVGKTGGTFQGHAYFECEPKHGVLVAFSKIKILAPPHDSEYHRHRNTLTHNAAVAVTSNGSGTGNGSGRGSDAEDGDGNEPLSSSNNAAAVRRLPSLRETTV